MKAFILCGGFGTRLDYEGTLKAKPMVRIGNKPILIHLIESFFKQEIKEFVLCLGHKSETIINYFLIEKKKFIKNLKKDKKKIVFDYKSKKLNITISLVMTEINTGTGGRILLANKILSLNEDIIMTYGDGLSDINIKRLIKFHYTKNADVTLTAVRPKQRYGVLKIEKNRVKQFDNRNKKIDVYVNGGFFIISKRAIKTIKAKETYWENQPLNYLIKRKKLFAYKHNGFWKSLDTMKDKNDFNEMYKKKITPWIR